MVCAVDGAHYSEGIHVMVCMDVYRVGSDGSMITSQGCVGIKAILVACAAIMAIGRWA